MHDILLVSPVLGDTMKDLRAAHSQFLSELQSSAFESIQHKDSMETEFMQAKEDVIKLQGTAKLLDQVKNFSL